MSTPLEPLAPARLRSGWGQAGGTLSASASPTWAVQLPPALQPAFDGLKTRATRTLRRGYVLLMVGVLVAGASALFYRGTVTSAPASLAHVDVPASVTAGLENDPAQLDKLRDYVSRGLLEAQTLRLSGDDQSSQGEVEYLRAQSAVFALALRDLSASERETTEVSLRTLVKALLPNVAKYPERYDARTLYVLEQAAYHGVRSAPARTVEAAYQAKRTTDRRWGSLGLAASLLVLGLGAAGVALGGCMQARVGRITAAIQGRAA
ncbi:MULTISPECIES: hypothetical protein [Cupriavidus]